MNQSSENLILLEDRPAAGQTDTTDVGNDSGCECEQPGYFYSGVPGIIARIENGQLAEGATVERCDLCRQYLSDSAALVKLRELGIA